MKKINLGQTISILANLGVVAGIVFLAYELRQNTLAIQLEAASSFQPNISQILLLLLEDDELADIVRKGTEGERLTGTEEMQLRTFYMSVLRSWQNPHYQYRTGAMESELWDALRRSLLETLRRDIGLRRYWQSSNHEEFPPEFVDFMDRLMLDVGEQ